MKLGKRLQHIESSITSNYDHIWDCCCDHGLLGMSLLANNINAKVHFVDIVPHLMNELEQKLHIYPATKWQTHCIDVSKLPLNANLENSTKHLIIIAGIGGEQTCQLINEICEKNTLVEIDFLLCPVHQLHSLRQQLIKLNVQLVSESLIEENERFYEVLLLSKSQTEHKHMNTVSPAGNQLWLCQNPQELALAQTYLNNTLNHYKRMQQGAKNKHIEAIINDYQKIRAQLDNQAKLMS